MMKKIKLLTFSDANSFGALLQCYALCKVLVNMDYEVELLKIPLQHNDYGFLGNQTYKVNKLLFGRFIKHQLPRSINYDRNEINNNDIFIVGSDQVWNPDLTKDVALDYFFSFLPDNVKRIAYAASFGNSEWLHKNIESEVGICLKKFSAIGVRELSGIEICKNNFMINSELTLDPTFLLDDYSELINRKNNTKETLVFFSLSNPTLEKLECVKHIGNQIHARPLMLNVKRCYRKVSTIPFLTVNQWLSHIVCSSFVITDSFHCTVFAIIFRKPFIVINPNKKRAGRIHNLLELLDLRDRYCPVFKDLYESFDWKQPINYDKVSERLNTLKANSLKYLKKALEQ